MKHTAKRSLVYVMVLSALLFWTASSAPGVVLHPDGEPNLVTWMQRPANDVVGRWGNVASCVVVSSNCVITTKHQAYNVNTFVEISGKSYTISEVWDHNTADLRIAKLYAANLANFIDIYEDTNEVGKDIVIGGYGNARGELLREKGITYGYSWDKSNNTTLRFGTNKIQYIENDINNLGLDVIIADFDGLNEGDSTIYECIVANHDSGSGWFIKEGDTWKVAGLSRAVQIHYEKGHEGDPNYVIYEQSWFRDSNDPNIPAPDLFDAVRLSSYAQWIYNAIQDALSGDLTGDNCVDFGDFAVLANAWKSQSPIADINGDTKVDFFDVAQFTADWLKCNRVPATG